jgi:hypothetical protein
MMKRNPLLSSKKSEKRMFIPLPLLKSQNVFKAARIVFSKYDDKDGILNIVLSPSPIHSVPNITEFPSDNPSCNTSPISIPPNCCTSPYTPYTENA